MISLTYLDGLYRSDVIFYALHKTTGELVESQEIINIIERYNTCSKQLTLLIRLQLNLLHRALDLQEEPINSVFQDCKVLNVKVMRTSVNRTTYCNMSDPTLRRARPYTQGGLTLHSGGLDPTLSGVDPALRRDD